MSVPPGHHCVPWNQPRVVTQYKATSATQESTAMQLESLPIRHYSSGNKQNTSGMCGNISERHKGGLKGETWFCGTKIIIMNHLKFPVYPPLQKSHSFLKIHFIFIYIFCLLTFLKKNLHFNWFCCTKDIQYIKFMCGTMQLDFLFMCYTIESAFKYNVRICFQVCLMQFNYQ